MLPVSVLHTVFVAAPAGGTGSIAPDATSDAVSRHTLSLIAPSPSPRTAPRAARSGEELLVRAQCRGNAPMPRGVHGRNVSAHGVLECAEVGDGDCPAAGRDHVSSPEGGECARDAFARAGGESCDV